MSGSGGTRMSTLDLGVIGNCTFGALVDSCARIVWCCLPRFDSDPVFASLLAGDDSAAGGCFAIEIEGLERHEQHYIPNTAILVTRLYAGDGSAIEITDFAPRFMLFGRRFRPTTLVRRIAPLTGTPRVRIVLQPRFDWGATAAQTTHGSDHIRPLGGDQVLRLTANAPISYLLGQTPFLLENPISLILGPDEPLNNPVAHTAREFQEHTTDYWLRWVRQLALPLEWQDAVIRAAITLKLCALEETGAIVAAMTTSIPEAPGSGRNWDYRYCWLRDAFFVVRALNSLSEVQTMEHYLRYLNNIVSSADGGAERLLQPVYGIALERRLTEQRVESLPGYRGMGPVRCGNQAFEHKQHDVYGNVVLAASQAFFDRRLRSQQGVLEFERLEAAGVQAYRLHDQPDAGMWELRTRARVHTSSALMCWAACDRLAKIAQHLGLERRARIWAGRAARIHAKVIARAWNQRLGTFVESFDGESVDAGLLLMAEVGFLAPGDPRFRATVAVIERDLRQGPYLFRYAAADDFGAPRTAFNICTFWYIDALARLDRKAEAREIFESMLACRNGAGLLSEDIDPETGELWGNYPQTYSLVGIVNAAMRLSRSWESAI